MSRDRAVIRTCRNPAPLSPQFLGLRAVVVKSFARIHAHNLINFRVLPLTFVDSADYIAIQAGDVLRLVGVRRALAEHELLVENVHASQASRSHIPCRPGRWNSRSAGD